MMDEMALQQSSQANRCGTHERPGSSFPKANPFFSVVTASLNSGRTIAAALESVKNQTYEGVEHIVIDGGSTDETLEVLKHYEAQYPLRWISEPDRGLADAMNKGVHAARGCYVIFIHADDALIEPNILECVFKHLEAQCYDICSFPILFKDPHGRFSHASPIRLRWWHRFRNTIRHQGCFVHRRLYERLSGYNTTFAISADYDFFYRAFRSGASIRYFDEPVSMMGGEGISSDPRFLLKRLEEEQMVQALNEQNLLWRAAQRVFCRLYVPYKARRLSRLVKRLQA